MPILTDQLAKVASSGDPKSPLASKLLKSVLSVYLLVALLVTGVQLLLEYREERFRLQQELGQVADAFLPVLTTSLWNLDDDQLERSSNGIWVNSAIGRIRVNDDLDQQLISRSREFSYLGLSSESLPWYEYSYAINYSDNFENDLLIGQLTLGASSLVVVQRATSTFFFTIVNAFIKTLVLWVFFYYALVKWVSRPLHRLTQSLHRVNPDSSNESKADPLNLAELHTNDELGDLAKGFTDLESALVQKNKAIEERQNHLEETVQELERVSNAKSVFLAHMSHELRTPLNGILGMIDFLQDTNLDNKQSVYVSTLANSGSQLLSVINNVLDFSKIESGKLELERGRFDLKALVDDCLRPFLVLAKKKDLELELDFTGPPSVWVVGDAVKIMQILNNLIGNAIKFTAVGKVSVVVECTESAGRLACSFAIRDTGVGITETEQGQLFKSFTQLDKSSTRKFGGTGLGLAISKQLIEFMGGAIRVESSPGSGSCFAFDLSLENADEAMSETSTEAEKDPGSTTTSQARESEEVQFSHLKVLVAEDNPVNQMVIGGLLEKLGIKADITVDGKQALDKCAVSDNPYDLVLMDIEMPEMDGWEATRELRKQNVKTRAGEPLKIIGLSAHALNIKDDLTHARGMDGYISKPVNLSELSRVLQEVWKI